MTSTSSETRQNIINVARKAFAQKGYYGTSTGFIINEAGISKGALYWHFKNKLDLFRTVIEVEMERVRKMLYPSIEDLEEQDLRLFFIERGELMLDYYLSHRESALLLLHMNLEAQRGTGDMASLASDYTSSLIDGLVNQVVKLRPEYTQYSGDLDLKELATLFEAVFNGLLLGINIKRNSALTKKLWRFVIYQLFPQEEHKDKLQRASF